MRPAALLSIHRFVEGLLHVEVGALDYSICAQVVSADPDVLDVAVAV